MGRARGAGAMPTLADDVQLQPADLERRLERLRAVGGASGDGRSCSSHGSSTSPNSSPPRRASVSVTPTGSRRSRGTELTQQDVPRVMAERVVELFEVVEVDDQQRGRDWT